MLSSYLGAKNTLAPYFIQGAAFEPIKSHRDLGVTIRQHLKPSFHIASAVRKANSILAQIKPSFSITTPETFVEIYKTFVQSQQEFAVQAWNLWLQKGILLLEGVQRIAMRMVVGVTGNYEERLKSVGPTRAL